METPLVPAKNSDRSEEVEVLTNTRKYNILNEMVSRKQQLLKEQVFWHDLHYFRDARMQKLNQLVEALGGGGDERPAEHLLLREISMPHQLCSGLYARGRIPINFNGAVRLRATAHGGTGHTRLADALLEERSLEAWRKVSRGMIGLEGNVFDGRTICAEQGFA
jgi:hypothetical protein